MGKLARSLVSVPLALCLLYTLYLNAALYHQPRIATIGGTRVNAELLAQLRHLEGAVQRGAAEDMQALYPEGLVFMHALYGSAWADAFIAWSNALDAQQPVATE